MARVPVPPARVPWLDRQAGADADDTEHHLQQVQAEQAAEQQDRSDDEQRHGDQVQDQVGRVAVVGGIAAPLPGEQVGMTFAHVLGTP